MTIKEIKSLKNTKKFNRKRNFFSLVQLHNLIYDCKFHHFPDHLTLLFQQFESTLSSYGYPLYCCHLSELFSEITRNFKSAYESSNHGNFDSSDNDNDMSLVYLI